MSDYTLRDKTLFRKNSISFFLREYRLKYKNTVKNIKIKNVLNKS